MEDAEIPLEHLQEQIHHHAEHSGGWISGVALSTAVLAVLAAIAGLLAGSHANEAMMNQIEASDQWGYYQAKSIKAAVLEAKTTLGSSVTEEDRAKMEKYREEEAEIKSEAEHKQADAKRSFHKHEVFARAVTMFQIAIAIAAISALTKRWRFWVVSMAFGVVGAVFLVLGFLAGSLRHAPRARDEFHLEAAVAKPKLSRCVSSRSMLRSATAASPSSMRTARS